MFALVKEHLASFAIVLSCVTSPMVMAQQTTSPLPLTSANESELVKNYPKVSMKTSMGEIVLELYPDAAPKTVENFLRYAKKGHYNNTIFHRVIDNFMIQGGGMDAKMSEKRTSKPVISEAGIALEKGLKNDLGTIAMARTDDPNSARAQFYINVNFNDFLNHQVLPEGDPVEVKKNNGATITLPRSRALIMTAGYTPFGKVVEGWEVVEKIKAVPTDVSGIHQNVPVKPVTIISVKLIK